MAVLRFRALVLLFLALLALYLATSGGHTSSNDEEELYYVTQGLVERGSLALPPEEARALAIPRGAALGPDGSYYTPYGLLPSVLAVPFYLLGDAAAGAFDPRFHGLITRAAVTALSALATAGSAVLVALLALELGASAGGALGLAGIYGVSTIAWPYARAFWSEPLATFFLLLAGLSAVRGSRSSSAGPWLLASLALGLAVATRGAMLAVLPVFAVYLALGTSRAGSVAGALRGLLVQAAGFGLGFLAPALALGAYNWVRFGSPLENGTGFGRGFSTALAIFEGDVGEGLYGLLLSPGKSVFLYSPPLICGLLALPALWRKTRLEAVLVAGVVAAQVALAAPLVFWHGDSAWGPRYLVPATPFLLLPLAAWLAPGVVPGWRRVLLAGAVALGVAVQVVAVLANPHTYILATGGPDGPGAQRRWFEPAASPLLAAPRQVVDRFALYATKPPAGTFGPGDGFYAPEAPGGFFPRWTGGQARVALRPEVAGPADLRLELFQPEPNGLRPVPELALRLDGQPLDMEAWQVERLGAGRYLLRVPLPELSAQVHELTLESPTFVPSLLDPRSDDRRALGVYVLAVELEVGGARLSPVTVPSIPPLPVSAAEPWGRAAFGWFYDPAIPHLVDLWPWYFSRAGLRPPDPLVGCIGRCLEVVQAYRHVLGREPDSTGWLGYYLGGLDLSGIREELCGSPEGRARGCTAAGG